MERKQVRRRERTKEGKRQKGDTADLFKNGHILAVAFPRNHSGTAHQPCCQVVHNVAIEIWHHHHIKLVWVGHQLKRIIIIRTTATVIVTQKHQSSSTTLFTDSTVLKFPSKQDDGDDSSYSPCPWHQ